MTLLPIPSCVMLHLLGTVVNFVISSSFPYQQWLHFHTSLSEWTHCGVRLSCLDLFAVLCSSAVPSQSMHKGFCLGRRRTQGEGAPIRHTPLKLKWRYKSGTAGIKIRSAFRFAFYRECNDEWRLLSGTEVEDCDLKPLTFPGFKSLTTLINQIFQTFLLKRSTCRQW